MQRVHARGQSNRWQRLLSAATRVHTKPSRLRLKISRTANKPGPHLVMTQRRVTDGHTSGTTNTPRLCRRLGSQHIPSRPKRFISTAQLPPTLHVVWFGTSENVDSVSSRVCFYRLYKYLCPMLLPDPCTIFIQHVLSKAIGHMFHT